MGKRQITVPKNLAVTPCPKCGNTTRFTLHAERCAEDLCETFVVCTCGYEATGPDGRYENVWGEMDGFAARVALECWNDSLACLDDCPPGHCACHDGEARTVNRTHSADAASADDLRILGLPVVLDPTLPVGRIILRSGENEVQFDVPDAARAAGGAHGA